MPRSNHASLTLASLLALAGSIGALPLSGCQEMNNLSVSRAAMDLLSQQTRDAANSYVSKLSSIIKSLNGVRDVPTAMDFIKNTEPDLAQLGTDCRTLMATTGSERTNLLKAFGAKFDSLGEEFSEAADKAKENSRTGIFVSPMLDKIKLFKAS